MIKNNDLDNLKNLNRNIIQNKPNSAPATPQRLFVYLDGIAQTTMAMIMLMEQTS
ncbi:hypothetical protein [Acinetobacter baumannii]|uniref:hypothetical protein n=1 Tax=Acinetobacter baumannii TaxID=470 RepID=UPI001E57B2B3|nr:hypothetical protein [Acinetobacter baumannii]